MTYPTLKKLYYQNENTWKKEYQNRYSASFTERFEFTIKEYNHKEEFNAFLCYTPEIVKLMDSIYQLNIELISLHHFLPPAALIQYTQYCMVEEIQSSNEIEGVRSSRKEIREAIVQLKSLQREKPSRFYSIVEKYNKLISRKKIDFKTSADIRKFYDSFVLDEVVAENPKNTPDGKIFRSSSVEILSGTQKILHVGLYPEDKLIYEMDKALLFLNSDKAPFFVRLAIFHYLFGYLHPFYDGNGRTIRFITSYYIAVNFSPLTAFNLSLFIKRNKKIYYKMFQETHTSLNCGDLVFFVTEFLNIIKQSMKKTINYLSEKIKELDKYNRQVKDLKLPDELTSEIYNVLLQATLFSPTGITMQDIISSLDKSRNTIIKRLDNIPDEHLVIDTSEKPYRYKLNLTIFNK